MIQTPPYCTQPSGCSSHAEMPGEILNNRSLDSFSALICEPFFLLMTLFEVYSFYHSRPHPVCAFSFEVISSIIAATEVKFSTNNKQNITEYFE